MPRLEFDVPKFHPEMQLFFIILSRVMKLGMEKESNFPPFEFLLYLSMKEILVITFMTGVAEITCNNHL